jgi:hypothetical protein
MSWSIAAVGRPAAVAAKVAEDIAKIKCSEPEESIKNRIGAAIVAACEAMPSASAVRVEANGSQYVPQGDGVMNSAYMKIEPLYGFVE